MKRAHTKFDTNKLATVLAFTMAAQAVLPLAALPQTGTPQAPSQQSAGQQAPALPPLKSEGKSEGALPDTGDKSTLDKPNTDRFTLCAMELLFSPLPFTCLLLPPLETPSLPSDKQNGAKSAPQSPQL